MNDKIEILQKSPTPSKKASAGKKDEAKTEKSKFALPFSMSKNEKKKREESPTKKMAKGLQYL